MAVAQLKVEMREKGRPSKVKALRREGRIPGIYYTSDADPILLSMDDIVFTRVMSKEVNVIDIVFSDEKAYKCVIRDIQVDPVTDKVVHVDFLGIKLDVKVSIHIPIILKGIPTGVKDEGGVLEHVLRQVEVLGLPLEIPEHIEVDVSEVGVGDVIHVSDLQIENCEILTDGDQDLASVSLPKVIEETTAEELEEGLETEEGAEGEKAASTEE